LTPPLDARRNSKEFERKNSEELHDDQSLNVKRKKTKTKTKERSALVREMEKQ